MKNKTFLQRCWSLVLGILAVSLGALAAISTSAWNPRSSQQEQGKFFQKRLPILPEPVKLLEIKTASQTFTFPDELLTLTVLDANRDLPKNKSDKWSFNSPSEASLKEGPVVLKIKDISSSGPYSTHPYMEVQVGDSNDWLKGAAFKLRNDSGKNIHHISLELSFPETRFSGNMMSYPISLGRIPNRTDDQREPLLVKPDEEVTIAIDDKIYSGLVRFLERRQPIASINKASIRLWLIVFDDATAWWDGEYRQQDPDDPRRFVPIQVKPPKR